MRKTIPFERFESLLPLGMGTVSGTTSRPLLRLMRESQRPGMTLTPALTNATSKTPGSKARPSATVTATLAKSESAARAPSMSDSSTSTPITGPVGPTRVARIAV